MAKRGRKPTKNIEDMQAYQREYYQAHREELSDYYKEYFKDPENLARRKARARDYYYRHREEILQKRKENGTTQTRQPEKKKEYDAKYRREHRQEIVNRSRAARAEALLEKNNNTENIKEQELEAMIRKRITEINDSLRVDLEEKQARLCNEAFEHIMGTRKIPKELMPVYGYYLVEEDCTPCEMVAAMTRHLSHGRRIAMHTFLARAQKAWAEYNPHHVEHPTMSIKRYQEFAKLANQHFHTI